MGSQTEAVVHRARSLGVKPLYYTLTDDGSLFFGSEIKTILVTNAIKPELNYAALPDYLANHSTSGEDTLFVGIKRLLPGHTATLERRKNLYQALLGCQLRRPGRKHSERQ
jgi:asparagine synthetase B (glutamine-hydrolysing)